VDPATIVGTGRAGRLTKADVLEAAAHRPAAHAEPQGRAPLSAPPLSAPPLATPPPAPEAPGSAAAAPALGTQLKRREPAGPPLALDDAEQVREPMTPLRRRIAQRLVDAQHGTATLTTFNEIDMSAVQALRAQHKVRFQERHGIALGFMSLFGRAAIASLADFPGLNAAIDGNDIIYHRRVHLGVAVSTKRGLIVPVVKNADRMSLAELEREIAVLAGLARDGKSKPDQLTGGTFTISNGGVYGSLLSTPILNPPQSGVLGMHKIQERPVAVNGAVVIRPMMYLALSYDHRLVDGEQAVKFLVGVKERIEDPSRLLLEL
jgi:2-oxoglutarate dehydrogenase E2 component (dihydrolipoamide succinyltransferase)